MGLVLENELPAQVLARIAPDRVVCACVRSTRWLVVSRFRGNPLPLRGVAVPLLLLQELVFDPRNAAHAHFSGQLGLALDARVNKRLV